MYCKPSGSNIVFRSWELFLIFTGFVDLRYLLRLAERHSKDKKTLLCLTIKARLVVLIAIKCGEFAGRSPLLPCQTMVISFSFYSQPLKADTVTGYPSCLVVALDDSLGNLCLSLILAF